MTESDSLPDCLIIFTRYPQPGKTKTRLIPALGAEGAAELHRRMADYTVQQARALREVRSLWLQVHFVDGTTEQLKSWLGKEIDYQPQAAGDLGDRLIIAFQQAFRHSVRAVIGIGTDCPTLTTALLDHAFQTLQTHDLVLGPAADGGYYLIGLQKPTPELFQTIAWSTDQVLSQTLTIARQLGLSVSLLPILSDVDRPEDLENWNNANVSLPTLQTQDPH
jgi:hypothetical protein